VMRFGTGLIGLAVMGLAFPLVTAAADCPAALTEAKSKLATARTALTPQAPRTLAGYQGGSSEAPRAQDMQAPRGQDAQAPRGQDAQAPRSAPSAKIDDAQSPRGQDSQAPRSAPSAKIDDAQSPRGQDSQAPRTSTGGSDTSQPAGGVKSADPAEAKIATASKLISEAEQACQKGDMALSSQKANDALAALR
jgi:hypothetical protein